MKQLELKTGNEALVIVSHPDDETIWMGGTILRHPEINWTIVVLARRNDPDRYPRFVCAARSYHARGIISDLEDEGRLTLKESIPEIEWRLRRLVPAQRFDYIFTHGSEGEYGHPRHKGVHRVVKNLFRKRQRGASNLFFFAYTFDEKKKFCVPAPRADFSLLLSSKAFKTKQSVIRNLYGFSPRSFETQSSGRIETFKKFRYQ